MTILMLIVTLLMVFALPSGARRDLLFGVPVPPEFRSTKVARRALRSYFLLSGIPLASSILGLIFLRDLVVFFWVSELVFVVVAVGAFVAQNSRLKAYAVQPPLVREVELDPPERLPWFTWLGIPPLVLLAGIALCLSLRWDQLPARFPVSFDLKGTPEYWADRTARWVYGGLLLGGEQAVLLFVIALAVWYGSRRTEAMRKPAMLVMLAGEWMVALNMGDVRFGLATGIAIPSLVVQLVGFLLVVPAVVYFSRAFYKPSAPLDSTPIECWKGGIVYYNPNDAVLFVRRQDAIGFTFNLANRWSWAIFGGSLVVVATMLAPWPLEGVK